MNNKTKGAISMQECFVQSNKRSNSPRIAENQTPLRMTVKSCRFAFGTIVRGGMKPKQWKLWFYPNITGIINKE